MMDDEREHESSRLSQKAARWIVEQLAGTRGTGFRGTSDLEDSIFGWLMDHAIYEDET